ncbi:MAG: tRNA (adenosine(37)-N6)-dimethylallyltransferase MiaA [Pirellulaceae bacterium]
METLIATMAEPTTFPSLTKHAWFLTGPTAAGKSSVAVRLAAMMDAEILSLDSMAIYRRMDIGTAKPTVEQRQSIPHHLLDLVEPDTSFSVAAYLQQAHQSAEAIKQRGKCPLFVGGTPLYLKACLRGFDSGPPADWEFRKSIERELESHGPEALRRRLQQVDPLSAHTLHPNDTRRMIRALEVAKLTGRPLSHQQIQFEASHRSQHAHVYALQWSRSDLHDRINQRVDEMFAKGLVEEVAALRNEYKAISRTATQAVGYKEVLAYLDNDYDLDEAIIRVKAHTRQLARRQETWLRSLPEVDFIQMSLARTAESVADEIFEKSKAKII